MSQPPSSKNKLGLWTSTSLVIGNMIGSGVFLMPAALAAFGGISLFGWLFAATGALLIAKVLSNLSKLVADSEGGPYAYTRAGFGDFMGFLVAWGYWISVWCSNAAIAVAFVGALSVYIPLLANNPVVAVLTGLTAMWFLTWLNTRGIIASGRMQLITTILKLLPLVLIAVFGLFYIKAENFIPFNTSGTSDFAAITATAALTFFAFLGIECATIPAGDVDNPDKTIPRATMLGTIITTVVYVLGTASVMGIIPSAELQQSVTPFADAAVTIWGVNARYWIGAGVAISAFGALNGWILIQGQIPYAIAKDKLFPAVFERKNKRGAPVFGMIIGSILASLLMIMNFTKGLVEQFKFLILLSTLSTLVPYLFSTASYVLIRLDKKYLKSGGRTPVILLASLAFAYSVWAIAGGGQETIYWGFLLLLAGVPFYVGIVWSRKKNL